MILLVRLTREALLGAIYTAGFVSTEQLWPVISYLPLSTTHCGIPTHRSYPYVCGASGTSRIGISDYLVYPFYGPPTHGSQSQ